MTVRSDRDVTLSSNGNTLQLFEDYGPVDSSLFLEAHGFVPHDNPHHCVVIPGPLIERAVAPYGIKETDKQLIMSALQTMGLAPAQSDISRHVLQDFCVRQDLSLVEDGGDDSHRPASNAIAVVSLLSGTDDSQKSLRRQCTNAVKLNAHDVIEISCARYPGNIAIVNGALKSAARMIVKEANSDSDGLHSEQTDAELSRLVSNHQRAEAEGSERMALAWRFRIQERRLLLNITSSAEEFVDNNKETPSQPTEELEEKLQEFNSFIDSLRLPINKLEARIIGDGMRIGTFAKEAIEEGDIYISLPSNATIDYESAIRDALPNLKKLLEKYRGSDRDGFMVLLIYLVHERFVMKEQSKWWPYLNLLPTVEDVKISHPLFYAESDIYQYLGGSHVGQVMIRYQQKTNQNHAALASDLEAHVVIGSEILLDKDVFRWASAIIDSRSIWWNGERHLTPLLDLVNADSVGMPHETQTEGRGAQMRAVTRASRHVQKGDQLF
jgi:HAMP domain-containing protein